MLASHWLTSHFCIAHVIASFAFISWISTCGVWNNWTGRVKLTELHIDTTANLNALNGLNFVFILAEAESAPHLFLTQCELDVNYTF